MRLAKKGLRLFPTDASVGDRDAEFELRRVVSERLFSRLKIAFEHKADDRVIAGKALADDVVPRLGLKAVILVRVGMAAIDEQVGREFGGNQLFGGGLETFSRVVRPGMAPSQN